MIIKNIITKFGINARNINTISKSVFIGTTLGNITSYVIFYDNTTHNKCKEKYGKDIAMGTIAGFVGGSFVGLFLVKPFTTICISSLVMNANLYYYVYNIKDINDINFDKI